MFTLQILWNMCMCISVWSDCEQINLGKQWRMYAACSWFAERKKEDTTVVRVFNIVNLAMEPLGIDSLL